MDIETLLTYFFDYFVPIILGLLILYFISRRLLKTAKMYLGMKAYVKKAIKLDRKKFNGLVLVDKIKRKRKRRTNSFQSLRGSAKRNVRKYFIHKVEEIPVFTRYTHGKLLKRTKAKVVFYIKQDSKTLDKFTMKQGPKQLIDCTNQHNCLDEMITFLHHLPDAILEKRDYDIYTAASDTTITYQLKGN